VGLAAFVAAVALAAVPFTVGAADGEQKQSGRHAGYAGVLDQLAGVAAQAGRSDGFGESHHKPSTKYGDIVCVAGALLHQGPVRWIRLYPIPFRYLESAAKFRKYETVKVELRPTAGDYRPESAKVNLEQIVGGPMAGDWKSRAPIVEQLAGPSMCDLLAGVTANPNATSLGAVRPRDVDDVLDFEEHGPWSPERMRKMQSVADQDSLFGIAETKQVVLQPPRFKVWLRWRCESPRCSAGHRMRILDWELTALQSRYGRSDTELKAAVTDNFQTKMFDPHKAPLIYVGNQENPTRRRSFTVLGVYYPDIRDAQAGLF